MNGLWKANGRPAVWPSVFLPTIYLGNCVVSCIESVVVNLEFHLAISGSSRNCADAQAQPIVRGLISPPGRVSSTQGCEAPFLFLRLVPKAPIAEPLWSTRKMLMVEWQITLVEISGIV